MTQRSNKKLQIKPYKRSEASKQHIRGSKQLSLKIGTPLIQTTFN